jgi:hypothetical protein
MRYMAIPERASGYKSERTHNRRIYAAFRRLWSSSWSATPARFKHLRNKSISFLTDVFSLSEAKGYINKNEGINAKNLAKTSYPLATESPKTVCQNGFKSKNALLINWDAGLESFQSEKL